MRCIMWYYNFEKGKRHEKSNHNRVAGPLAGRGFAGRNVHIRTASRRRLNTGSEKQVDNHVPGDPGYPQQTHAIRRYGAYGQAGGTTE